MTTALRSSEVTLDTREILRAGGELVLCREVWGPGQSPVLMLAPTSEVLSPAALARLEHELSLREDLDSEWAVRPIALTRHRGLTTLLLEDPGGELLVQSLGHPWELAPFLRTAIALARALGQLHERGLVHRDVKPANVLVDIPTGRAWLGGFGIASRLSSERGSPEPPAVIAGTLAYMAPEQTGRMNRSVDSRSDLYSYGVTLYEMLTGALPFEASDPMGWVHCHMAKQPPSVAQRAPDVPPQVAAIIEKLLAKAAEDRYQTAAGVTFDLRLCLGAWESHRRIDSFPLRTRDASDRLRVPERLYGREAEIETLLASFERVVQLGRTELVLVSGYSGIGKSSVVSALPKVLAPPRGRFAAGKADQYKRDIPYATLAQAFQSLVRQLLSKDDREVSHWRDSLLQALGGNGQLIVSLIPELALIIGDSPPVPDLAPKDAQSRFQLVFREFVGVFARAEHPLALFLDDLQWLDTATLDLLEHLVTHPAVRHLLLIGAYRDNEVGSSHPLVRTLASIRKAGAPIEEIVLAPLTPNDLAKLVSDSLHCETASACALAQLVHEKTDGNPFFAIQFLLALVDERLLAFEHDRALWTWDLPGIGAKELTDNVLDLMTAKLRRLPESTQRALGEFAYLGNSAELDTLTLVLGGSQDEIHGALREAAGAGLVCGVNGGYAFVHDRVQEAAYTLVPDGERAATHLRIGRLLTERTAEELEETIFEVVNHLNLGASLVKDTEECVRVARLNLMAGKRAKTSTAYAAALKYLASAFALLAEDGWEHHYDLAFAIELHRAECELLTGHHEAAEERLAVLSRRARTLVDQAAVTCLEVDLYTGLARFECAVEVALAYLRKGGGDWSVHPAERAVRQAYDRLWQQLGSRSIEALADLPRMRDPLARATMGVLTRLMPATRPVDENLGFLVALEMASLSLECGNTDASSCGYIWASMTAGAMFGDYSTTIRLGQLGLDLVEKGGLDGFAARVYMLFGTFVVPWLRHFRSGQVLLRRASEAGTRSGDFTYCGYSYNNLITNLLVCGEPLDKVERVALEGLEFSRKARLNQVVELITPQLRLIRMLRGMTRGIPSFDEGDFDEVRYERHLEATPDLVMARCWYWVRKLQACLWANEPTFALAAGAKAEEGLWTSRAFPEYAEFHFFAALARAQACRSPQTADGSTHFAALLGHYRQLETWAGVCRENFGDRAALVGAEIARLEGRELDAERLYEEAIRLAREHGFVHVEATANELAARFHAARGVDTIARAYLREARLAYLRWGAAGKVRLMEQLYPHLREEIMPSSGPTVTIDAAVEGLDWATVVKLSQALSREIVLDKCVHGLMSIVLEHAGADRGVLLLPQGEDLRVIAEAILDSNGITVRGGPPAGTLDALPGSLIRYASRTRETVLLDDTSMPDSFLPDEYFSRGCCRSVLCVPLVKQGDLIGLLYLENRLAPRVFTPQRSALLGLVASHAAVALDHARLFTELAEENAERRRAEERLEQRLAFEHFISDLSADLTQCVADSVDARITCWLERVSSFLDIDRAELLEYAADTNVFCTTAFWCSPDQPPPPASTAGASLPAILDHLRHNDGWRYETPGEMPASDRWIFDRAGIRSVLGVPASVEGVGVGCLVLGAVRDERRWPDELVQRLRVIADILANAVARRHAEQDRKVQRELAKALEFRELVLGILGHDLRSPLSAASALTQLILRHEGLPEAVARRVAAIDSSMERMNDLIGTLLDFTESRFKGAITVARTATDLRLICARVVREQLAQSPRRTILERCEGPIEGNWDPVRLEQVVSNLLSNALKHGNPVGPVEVRTHVDGNDVVLEVANEGQLIPTDVLGKLFEPFWRGSAAEPEGRRGLGLGLYIVRQITIAHGGSVAVESTREGGTVFTVRLPRDPLRPDPAR
jgi:predicted ATPase/signal transduction histidine kinase